jgi:hypothetical protein|tara:strand:- start:2866 stop:3030 length:165 start_codon:yes stop_codon:yes gene_type:complete
LHFKALFGELGADEGVRDEGYSPEFEAHPAVNNVITTIIRLRDLVIFFPYCNSK